MESAVYSRRRPEQSVLHRVVRENWLTFRATVEQEGDEGRKLPAYVVDAFERYLDCGILAKGFARVRCPECEYNFLVAFSCKERGICPSCEGRRMNDQAAHLVDRVLPKVPVRQWVLSMPRRVRYHLGRKGRLKREALSIFLGEVIGSIKRRMGRRGRGGAVTVVQRFGGALNANVHFHSLVLDGLYVRGAVGEAPVFVPAPAPTQQELEILVRRIKGRIMRLLVKRGAIGDAELGEEDPEPEAPTLMDLMAAASIKGMIALSPVPKGVAVLGREEIDLPAWEGCQDGVADKDGFNLHARVRIEADDREGLERLCRYILRPPFALDRFSLLPDGRVIYRMKRAWRDGTSHLVLSPLELIEKLAALVPPPRQHLLHYHGILGPNAAWREQVVLESPQGVDGAPKRAQRIAWAELLKRTFGIDVLACPKCLPAVASAEAGGARMRLIACISQEQSEVIEAILRAMGLPVEAPSLAPSFAPGGASAGRPARSPPQSQLPWSHEDVA